MTGDQFIEESCLKPLAIPLRGMLPVSAEEIENILFSKESWMNLLPRSARFTTKKKKMLPIF